jgi:hypothetical protein
MERDLDLLKKLLSVLREHGYPEDSFALQWRVGNDLWADLAVVDPDTSEPVALFEFKRSKSAVSHDIARRQMQSYARALGNPDIPLYLVFPADDPNGLSLRRLAPSTSDEPADVKQGVPDFSLLRNSGRSKVRAAHQERHRRDVDHFGSACWALAAIVAVLLVLDFTAVVQVTVERLTLLGLLIALVVLPFASKIKFPGWEFERKRDKRAPEP